MPYKLAFKDRFYSLAEDMQEANPSVPHCGGAFAFGTLEETGNKLLLQVSAEEMQILFTSALQGCQLLYPEKAQTLLEILLRTVDCGDYLTTLCEDIADCIENPSSPSYTAVTNISEEVSVTNIENNNEVINTDRTLEPEAPNFLEKRFKEIDRQEPILEPEGTCNTARKNEIYAGTLEIVTRISQMAQDLLEDINAQADAVQSAARTVALVPLIGDALGETILIFAEKVPDILNAYLSHDSLEQHEDVACSLFCMHKDECGYPTFDELINYYKVLGLTDIGNIASVSMNALVDAVAGTHLLGNSVIWHAMNTFVLYFLYVESTFLGRRGKKWIGIYAANGELLPNDDWMLLCDCGVTQWDWNYDTDTCSYGLPSGWSLTIGASAGTCGGSFAGIWDISSGSPAVVSITVSFPAQLITNVRMGGFINGPHASNGGTVHLSAGTVSITEALGQAPTIDNHNFTVDEVISSFTITATHATSTQNPRLALVKSLGVNV